MRAWAKPLLLFLLPLLFFGPAGTAVAQDSLRIAAVVNDDIVSQFDVEARTRIAIVSSSLDDTPEVRERLAPQVLRTLIDDRLKLQEAKRLGISVTDAEVERGLQRLADQNTLDLEGFRAALQGRGIPIEAVGEQIRAEIAWAKLAQRRLRPSINISEEEVDEELRRIQENAGKPEYLVAEIFLPVDTPQQDNEVRGVAERLMQEIRDGAAFDAVARQFSQAATAARGGILGWVRPGQLEPKLDAAVRELVPGQMSPLIRSTGGYHILMLRDQRQIGAATPEEGKVSMAQAFFPVPVNPTAKEVARAEQRAREAAQGAETCADLEQAAQLAGSQPQLDLTDVGIGSLPAPLRRLALNLPVEQASDPVRLPSGIGVFMVCAREADEAGMPTRLDIANDLARSRLELLARGYLRDLRRAAYVELRS